MAHQVYSTLCTKLALVSIFQHKILCRFSNSDPPVIQTCELHRAQKVSSRVVDDQRSSHRYLTNPSCLRGNDVAFSFLSSLLFSALTTIWPSSISEFLSIFSPVQHFDTSPPTLLGAAADEPAVPAVAFKKRKADKAGKGIKKKQFKKRRTDDNDEFGTEE